MLPSAAAMENRVLKLDGVHNFRDYGGYAGAGRAKLKTGLLWRSAQHGEASAADLAAIHALGITTVVDLRGLSEREAKPCLRHPDFAAQVFAHPDETAGLALHTEAADGVISAAEARAAMVRLYEGIPFRANLVPMLRCYFEVLGRAEGPSLIHCVAGKDRTGFAAALILHSLGVAPSAVMQDYLLTNQLYRPPQAVGGDAPAEVRDAIRRVQPDYLQAALEVVDNDHGGMARYLEDGLGLDAKKRSILAKLYLSS